MTDKMSEQNKEMKWKCRMCPEQFKQLCDLVEHINDKHLQGAVTVLRADRKYERTENKGHI